MKRESGSDKYLSLEAGGERYDVHKRTFARWLKQFNIPVLKPSRRTVRVRESDLEKYLDTRVK